MTKTPSARRRLTNRLALFMLIYLAALTPVVYAAHRHLLPEGPMGFAVAIAPALPVIGLIWAMLRYFSEEEDEYRRMLQVKAFVGATGLTLAVTTVWGFIQAFDLAPTIPLFYVFVLFCVSQAAVGMVVSWSDR